MTLKLADRYPGRFDPASVDYPLGKFKNRSSPTAQDGSYMERDWLNDWGAFLGAILSNAGAAPNGILDTAQSSQSYNALWTVIQKLLPKRTFAGNDYIRIPDVPGGLIIQWFEFDVTSGWVSSTAAGTSTPVWQAQKTVTLPTLFPNTHVASLSQCVFSAQTLTWGPATPFITGRTNSTLSVSVLTSFNPVNNVTVRGLSVGY